MKQPLWVMCMLCGDVIYGGPGMHPIPRECVCTATVVIPTPERGVVRWDGNRYAEAGEKEPEVEWTEEVLDPMVSKAPVEHNTIDSLYKHSMDKFTKTGVV